MPGTLWCDTGSDNCWKGCWRWSSHWCFWWQKRNYEYFYLLADNDIIEPEFRELLSIIKTVSYGIDDETKNIIFGYIENITVLADIYAYKKMEK